MPQSVWHLGDLRHAVVPRLAGRQQGDEHEEHHHRQVLQHSSRNTERQDARSHDWLSV